MQTISSQTSAYSYKERTLENDENARRVFSEIGEEEAQRLCKRGGRAEIEKGGWGLLALLEVAQMWGLRTNKCVAGAPTPSAAGAEKWMPCH